MDPLPPQHTTPPPPPANGQASPPAADPVAAEAPPGAVPPGARQSGELEQLRVAREAHAIAGGLVARVDQIETKVIRVDRQVLMLIGMVAVVAWGVKAMGAKLDALEAIADGAAQAS